MKKKLRIGIPTALYAPTFGMHVNYIEWVAQFGEPVLLTPFIDQYDLFDVLFLPGGADWAVNDQNQLFNVGRSNSHLYWFADKYYWKCKKNKKAIIGICAGMQYINLAENGTLRNLYGEELKLHQQNKDEDTKNSLVHEINMSSKIAELCQFTKKESNNGREGVGFKVNSIHHQAIDELGDGLEVIAKCGDVIEAIKHKDLPVCGFQWHPEKIFDKFSEKVVKEMLKL